MHGMTLMYVILAAACGCRLVVGRSGSSMAIWSGEVIHLSWSPRLFHLKGFLTDAECQHLIKLAAPSMVASQVVSKRTGASKDSQTRTSSSTFFDKRQDAVVASIEQRVAEVTMVPVDHQEGIQVLHYRDGQKYDAHYDYFQDPKNAADANGGQRLMTLMVYLSSAEEGGETVFSRADSKVVGPQWSACAREGLAVKAIQGDALLFFNLRPNGSMDPTSRHASCPTTLGDKWVATKWIRVGAYGSYAHIEDSLARRAEKRRMARASRDAEAILLWITMSGGACILLLTAIIVNKFTNQRRKARQA